MVSRSKNVLWITKGNLNVFDLFCWATAETKWIGVSNSHVSIDFWTSRVWEDAVLSNAHRYCNTSAWAWRSGHEGDLHRYRSHIFQWTVHNLWGGGGSCSNWSLISMCTIDMCCVLVSAWIYVARPCLRVSASCVVWCVYVFSMSFCCVVSVDGFIVCAF